MLQNIEVENLDLSTLDEKDISIINTYINFRDSGGKVIFKRKVVKNGVFLNIYVYSKNAWKYYLEQSIKIE